MPPKMTDSLFFRWLLLSLALLLVVVMTGVYLVANNGHDPAATQMNIARESSRAVQQQVAALYEAQLQQAQRVASGINLDSPTGTTQATLEAIAGAEQLDSALLVNRQGIEVLGLVRGSDATYTRRMGTNLGDVSFITAVLEGDPARAGLLRTGGETMLYVAVPVQANGRISGAVLTGQRLERVLAAAEASAMTDIVLYDPAGAPLQTSFDPAQVELGALALPAEARGAALAGQTVPLQVSLGAVDYSAAFAPLVYGGETVGLLGVWSNEQAAATSGTLRQLSGLLLAVVAAAVIIGAFWLVARMATRVEHITQTAADLAAGSVTARTGLAPVDTTGRLGHALDRYADHVQEHQDMLRADLRRQRREITHLMSVLEALPEGVVVLDMDGRVTVMNDHARKLLGSGARGDSLDNQFLTALVTDRMGEALAPGIYALGSPQQLTVEGKVLNAQAAAVMTPAGQRIGTVVLLRDVTGEVQRERARERLLAQVTQQVQQPLESLAAGSDQKSLRQLAQEVSRNAVALQKLVLELRELSDARLHALPEKKQTPISLDTLIWSIANEWRQVAQANNLKLHVMIEKGGLYVLGDERRLRWALGNLIDNAIKYTPPGGDVTLEIRADTSEDKVRLRIRDNGVGIASEELPQVLTRFYRGSPVTREGRAIRVAGSGQGLTSAQHIIEAHGGTLLLQSRQWVGTALNITLPLTSAVRLPVAQSEDDLDGETVQVQTPILKKPEQR